ncbi:MAG: hypothetical protein ACKOYK_08025 [Cyanobium sp.]
MKGTLRRLRPPVSLFLQLSKGRFILRLFLIGLLFLLFLGYAGSLQNQLTSLGAGQTELAYALASVRNGASLRPIMNKGHFSKFSTADATLQSYLFLDTERGSLSLGERFKSLSSIENPLSSIPVQISEAPLPQSDRSNRVPGPTLFTSLYIHLQTCEDFLKHFPSQDSEPSPLSEADRVLRCTQTPPVHVQPSTLKEVQEWIRSESRDRSLLSTQQADYLKAADAILGKPPQFLMEASGGRYEWAPGSPVVPEGQIPVWRIFVLQDKASPGLKIYPVASSATRSQPLSATGRERVSGTVFRALDRAFLVFLQLRYPVLISVGILAPLLAWRIGQRDRVVRRCLEPYLLLLLAQAITLFVAESLMGEGLTVWVGFFYNLLRVVQLVGILWMIGAANHHLGRLFDLHPRPWLRKLLQFVVLLWSLNALGLGWHIFVVFRDFPYIAPA